MILNGASPNRFPSFVPARHHRFVRTSAGTVGTNPGTSFPDFDRGCAATAACESAEVGFSGAEDGQNINDMMI